MDKAWEALKKFFLIILILFLFKIFITSPSFQKEFQNFKKNIIKPSSRNLK
ncbi:MAG: hypothetical protein ACO2OW_02045 [Minisyncoccia bacterium]|jgi:hypothetical protein